MVSREKLLVQEMRKQDVSDISELKNLIIISKASPSRISVTSAKTFHFGLGLLFPGFGEITP